MTEEFLEEEEIRMIRYLLSNTKPNINRAEIETQFEASLQILQSICSEINLS